MFGFTIVRTRKLDTMEKELTFANQTLNRIQREVSRQHPYVTQVRTHLEVHRKLIEMVEGRPPIPETAYRCAVPDTFAGRTVPGPIPHETTCKDIVREEV